MEKQPKAGWSGYYYKFNVYSAKCTSASVPIFSHIRFTSNKFQNIDRRTLVTSVVRVIRVIRVVSVVKLDNVVRVVSVVRDS